MDVLYTEAQLAGLNAGDPASAVVRDPSRVFAVGRLLGYSDVEETGTERAITHRYRFLLFHLETLSVYRSAANAVYAANGARIGTLYSVGGYGPAEEAQWERVDQGALVDAKLQLAEKAAARVLYLTGLDFGMADIGIGSDDRPIVLKLEPFPSLDAPQAGRFAAALERYRENANAEAEYLEPATLGADPEFLLMNADGKVVQASAFLPRRGRAGCDLLRIGGKVMYPLAELRPEPSSDPRRLVTNVRRALLSAAELIPETPGMKWLAGGMPAKGFALGGHIHMSGVGLNVRLLRALDNYLALPLILIEDESSRARRPRYGVPGDYRRQPHGGFEYRTLPSWLVSPRVAKGVLALASVITTRYRQLRHRPLDRPDVLRRYFTGNKLALAGTVMPMLDQIRRMPEYGQYESMLSPLLTMMEEGQSWDERKDIRAGWKIAPPAAQPR
ncbi:hypothetical protein FE784_27280 [Paenibacillus hemerocallicola]|uniref:PhiEco32-like amidoligase-type 2 protein n=1 Tax=Paenibacillus hemerocallicola TaxID=1172614 RepID=A0A5C4T2Z9_9BACL|nr:hypothetical protein [Paenibacillus hemerocallicola]TNJ63110.1 hypothetical protein FE784_27280 [Paenibacillus hemerocallicola]